MNCEKQQACLPADACNKPERDSEIRAVSAQDGVA
jgi:hypothetical protein